MLASGVYRGKVRHRRFGIKSHAFSYPIYMLGLDLSEVEKLNDISALFSVQGFSALTFKPSDHFAESEDTEQLTQSVINKAKTLGANQPVERVFLLTQVRCFGLYFSPVNFYFLYNKQNEYSGMLAEVSNTPWGETHYYWIDAEQTQNRKDFHVSPFMPMDQHYKWKIRPPATTSFVHIENHELNSNGDSNKVFDATLQLKKTEFSNRALANLLVQHPMMTLAIKAKIYWQALKMIVKGFRFFSHPKTRGQHGTTY
jgi:hypothetical protein